MGKSSPQPPQMPDPYQTANAQAGANREAIRESALVNRYDQQTPWGSVTWEYDNQGAGTPGGGPPWVPGGNPNTGGGQLPDLGGGRDPLNPWDSISDQPAMGGGGQMSYVPGKNGELSAPTVMPQTSQDGEGTLAPVNYNDPLYNMRQVVRLSDQGQRIFDGQQGITESLTNQAASLTDQLPTERLNFDGLSELSSGINPHSLPGIEAQRLQTSLDGPGGSSAPGLPRTSGDQAEWMPGTPEIPDESGGVEYQPGFDPNAMQHSIQSRSSQIQAQTPNARFAQRAGGPNRNDLRYGVSPRALQTDLATEGLQRSVPSRAGQVSARAGAADAAGSVGTPNAGDLSYGVSPQSLQTDLATEGLQRSLSSDGLNDLNRDYAGQRSDVERAVFDRANSLTSPQMEADRNDLMRSLADRGIPVNSERAAFELDRLDRMQGEQRDRMAMAAVQAGGAEQSRLFGIDSTARGQQFNERATQGNFANQAAGQSFGQNLAAGQFGNAARRDVFGMGQQNAALNNQAQNQFFGQNLAANNQANQAAQQNFGNDLALDQYRNATQAQAQGMDIDAGQFANQAAGQAFGQNMAAGQFGNEARQAMFGMDQQNAGLNNQAQGQYFDQNLAATDQSNRATQQDFGNAMAQGQFRNQALSQAQDMDLQAGQFANQAQGQFFGQDMARSQQGFDQNLARAGFENQARTAQAGLDASLRSAGLNEALINAQLADRARTQGINERMTLRQNPLNELSAFIQGSPALQAPSPAQSPAFQMQAPDISGAIMNNYAMQQNAYTQQMQNRSANMGGLMNMGGAIGSAFLMSSREYKTDDAPASSFLERVKTLPVRAWRYKPAIEPDQPTHIGPYAEDWAARFGGSGREIPVVDAVGVLLKCTQELTERVEMLEAA